MSAPPYSYQPPHTPDTEITPPSHPPHTKPDYNTATQYPPHTKDDYDTGAPYSPVSKQDYDTTAPYSPGSKQDYDTTAPYSPGSKQEYDAGAPYPPASKHEYDAGSPYSTPTPNHGGYYQEPEHQSRYYEDTGYYEPKTVVDPRGTAADSQYYYDNQHTSAPPVPSEPYAAPEYEEKPEKKKRGYVHFICCPCCFCCPMWLRYICCFIFFVIIVLAITIGALAGTFKTPTLDMNGVTDDPAGLPRFQRSVEDFEDDMAFTVNLGLKIGINNPNVETLTFPSIGVVAYYPTSLNVPIATGEVRDVHINQYGTTNFTFPVHIHYTSEVDKDHVILRDIHSKCGKQDISVFADITAVVSVIGVKVTLPTIRRTIQFDCPISSLELPD